MTRALPVFLLLLVGCASQPPSPPAPVEQVGTEGWVLLAVDSTNAIYRGSQPPNNGWATLRNLGVTNVLKLNLEEEWSDRWAWSNGLRVVYVPIDSQEQRMGPVPKEKLDQAVGAVTPGTFVHDVYGRDRTGLIIALYRLKCGWTKADAEREMLSLGFHRSQFGLWEAWQKAQ